MAIINTGAVERTITGVNESDVNSQATIINLVENSASGAYGNNPASDSLVESPDGTISAVLPIPDSNSDRFEYQIQGGTYSTDTKLVYSWYRKRVTTPLDVSYTGDLRISSLSNMTTVGSVTQIETDVNGFDRFQAVVNITDGSLLSKVRGYFGYSIGVGNSSVAYWGHQLETGTEAREYAPTNGTALFIDNNSTSTVTNTGAVERDIEGKHDANFVRPLGDELITNGDFSTNTDWNLATGLTIDSSKLVGNSIFGDAAQNINSTNGETYKVIFTISDYVKGKVRFQLRGGVTVNGTARNANGVYTQYIVAAANHTDFILRGLADSGGFTGNIDNVSVKEVLVNRESTVTNTGVVERDIEGKHDANFVHPLGDELILNGNFSDDSDWIKSSGVTISNGSAHIISDGAYQRLTQSGILTVGKKYKIQYEIVENNGGQLKMSSFSGAILGIQSAVGVYTIYGEALQTYLTIERLGSCDIKVDNISIKEILVNRESTVTNTGAVERTITGIN